MNADVAFVVLTSSLRFRHRRDLRRPPTLLTSLPLIRAHVFEAQQVQQGLAVYRSPDETR